MLRLAVVTAFLLTGCSDTTTRSSETYQRELTPREQGDKIAASIQNDFGRGAEITVTAATCPEIDPDAAGTYRCEATANDVAFPVMVTLTPEPQPDGSSRTKLNKVAEGVVFVEDIAASMVEQIMAQKGMAVDMTCAGPALRLSTPGDRFACTVTEPRSGQTAPFVVTLTNETGGFDAQPGTL